MITLASLFDIRCIQLKGGYKAFRRYCQWLFEQPRNWKVVGGYTGSGKSELLNELQALGKYVLDLEALACHRGSAFGGFQDKNCPTTEQFENEIGFVLKEIPTEAPVFVEDESKMVGHCVIPPALFKAYNESEIYFITCAREERIARIVSEYGKISMSILLESLKKISKRLGREKELVIAACAESGALDVAVSHLLDYYDIRYDYALTKQMRTVHTRSKQEFLILCQQMKPLSQPS